MCSGVGILNPQYVTCHHKCPARAVACLHRSGKGRGNSRNCALSSWLAATEGSGMSHAHVVGKAFFITPMNHGLSPVLGCLQGR